MQFGLFYEWPNPTLRQWRTLFEEGVEQIQYSEALGFDYCLIAEHHFTTYGNSPAPVLQALYIGQRTRRLKIGTAAVIGEFVKIATPVTVFPKPQQRPYPPFLLMGTSVDSMRVAAQLDMLPFSSAMMGMEGVRAQFGALVHAHTMLGKPLANLRLGLQCMTHVAPTDEEAAEALRYVRWQMRAQRGLNRQEVTNGRVDASPYPNELDDKSLMDRLFFGSPETVIAKLHRAASVGVTHISNWMMFGGIEHEKLMRSIRLMGEEVIPALRDVQPPAELPAQLLHEPVVTNEELQASRLGRAPRDMAT